MKFLELHNISKNYAGGQVLKSVSFAINGNERYGLIGPNGSGKTTILRIITGMEYADDGVLSVADQTRMAVVPQTPVFDPALSVLQVMMAKLHPYETALRNAEDALSEHSESPDEGLLNRRLAEYARARESFESVDGDNAPARALELLSQADLADRADIPAGKLSGGEQSILSLISQLMTVPNLLILDEPGNHLDYRALAWLEEFIRSFRGGVLMVSHNRYLLDRCAGTILELRNGEVKQFRGNYSAYRIQRLRKAASDEAAAQADAKKVQQITEMVERFARIAASRPDPSWGKRLRAAKSRLKQEQSRARTSESLASREISMQFASGEEKGDAAIRIVDYSRAFPSVQLFNRVNLEIPRGSRIALIGENGSGKTTLLNDLVEFGHWDHPHLRMVNSLKPGYVMQEPRFSSGARTLGDEVQSWGAVSKNQAVNLILPMGFSFSDFEKNLSSLSGGEKNRLQIARIMYEKPDIIIMDEPTNHLDIPAREALEDALSDFRGTLLVVSHDRYFLDKLVYGIAEISSGGIELFEGSFTEYFHHRGNTHGGNGRFKSSGNLKQRHRERNGSASDKVSDDRNTREGLRLEMRLEEEETRKKGIERLMEQALERGDHSRARSLGEKLEKVEKQINQLYEKYVSL
ncbi:ABC-F family ATP-binding cassette domain-containing protein [Salinispira pacifica]|uniref:ATP-binding protein of ABC transporter n=1 Tax=Salinispira pacifica TaxID=1307761 RepID=V5WL02_9SPIO|nr:ABC-F family ATP-binding cassette domain-containing protein [Salinispira pacifica]AHC16428.1 ATP-binding protein of ABC transporter [Salinispira pacifica]